jgi:hypothetical protein
MDSGNNLIEFTLANNIFDIPNTPKRNSLIASSPAYSDKAKYTFSPGHKRKPLTVPEATYLANIRRGSRDEGKHTNQLSIGSDHDNNDNNDCPNLLGLLNKTLNGKEILADPFVFPSEVMKKERKQPNWVKVGPWYMDLNDEENADISPFSKAASTVAKIMDKPDYEDNLKVAEEAIIANKELDPTKDTPAAINALFATDAALANSLWATKDEPTIKSTVLEASSKVHVPTIQPAPKSHNSTLPKVPEIMLTRASTSSSLFTGSLRPSLGIPDSRDSSSVLDLKPELPYSAILPLPPVPTHPQVFKYTPTPIPSFSHGPSPRVVDGTIVLSRGGTESHEGEIDFDEFTPKFKSVLQQNKIPHTIPETHNNPVISAELALLHAQTMLPQRCNPAFKEVCPCELSGRECPFKITCSLKRCYVRSVPSTSLHTIRSLTSTA